MGTCLYERKPGVSRDRAQNLARGRTPFALARYALLCFALHLAASWPAHSQENPRRAALPNLDKRRLDTAAAKLKEPEQASAAARLRARVPDLSISLDPILGAPRWIASSRGFLSGPNGEGGAISRATAARFPVEDRHRAVRAFLAEHRALFGYGPEVLTGARIHRQFVGSQNQLRTVVWQQQLEEIDVFEGQLQAHLTAAGELVNLSALWMAEAADAATRGRGLRARPAAEPPVSAREAVAVAAGNLGEELGAFQVTPVGAPARSGDRKQYWLAPVLKGRVSARLVWLPLDARSLQLCWEVILTTRTRDEMYRLLVDAEKGEVLLRHSLTAYLSSATFRVFTSDSPTPLSPGHSTPSPQQPPMVDRVLVTFSALRTNASPNGWINDGDNETRGNNVDAHTDRNGDDVPDSPRPQGSPFRVFDFPMNLTNDAPSAYSAAAVTQLFYWNNWMHDQLYELGFDEAAGNFQMDNFGRGGDGNDAVQARAQEGGAVNGANMAVPPDGDPPRMQMYLFDGPEPDRDGVFDAEIVLHEYTHGMSARRAGGGLGLFQLQSAGLAEGWSDFYPLALLAKAGDDLDGNYAFAAYSSFQLFGLEENYYFGTRRYPYSTDLNKNPLTFKDLDPGQAGSHADIPTSPIADLRTEDEHNIGELWCAALWEVRANIIRRHGFAAGNRLILQLVTDGMNLTPAHPNFIEARTGIIQADQILTGGSNVPDIWAGFAKRGLGRSASCPEASTTRGIREAFDVPDDLSVQPMAGWALRGRVGGPFSPPAQLIQLINSGTNAISWTLQKSADWLSFSMTSGLLSPGARETNLMAFANLTAAFLPAGIYRDTLLVSNRTSGGTQRQPVWLSVGQPDFFTELFDQNELDLENQTLVFTPDGSPGFYSVCREPATSFPISTQHAKPLSLERSGQALLTLGAGATVSLYGQRTNTFFVGAEGYVSLRSSDFYIPPSIAAHFGEPRISGCYTDLDPGAGGSVSWQQLIDRVVVTFEGVPEFGGTNLNSFQIEMLFDGSIRLTHLAMGAKQGVVGLSAGDGVPAEFLESDLSAVGDCAPRLQLQLVEEAREGNGTLRGAGAVGLPVPAPFDVTVVLTVSPTSQEALVPATVIIPAGTTSALFDVTIVDDAELDGSQQLFVTAAASGYSSSRRPLLVHDNEPGTLSLRLPSSVSEQVGQVTGTVSVASAVAREVLVALTSTQPGLLEVPPFAIIPPGSTSCVFVARLVNDSMINGTRNVLVSAVVPYWTLDTATLEVIDDETLELRLELPATVRENAGRCPGKLTISGVLGTNLEVQLQSSAPNILRAPEVIVLPIGLTTVAFDLELVDDLIANGEQVVTVTAHALGWSNGTSRITVTDDEIPLAPGTPRPADGALNVPVTGRLAWSSHEDELISNGDFETGTLDGWRVDHEGVGQVLINDGRVDPELSPDGKLGPFEGRFSALTAQTGPGKEVVSQELAIPAAARGATLRWAHRIRNHATVFGARQGFRVEIRGLDETIREVAFSTQPGDPLLQAWSEHDFDLSAYRGQRIRVAFVEEHVVGPFNAHLDNVSVRLRPVTPVTFDVYLGTSPVLGPADQLGSTETTSWVLPVLAPLTTYYWQVRARRLGATPGPIWRFTTRGVSHFTVGTLAHTQSVSVPFPVTITARDELGQAVSNFTGAVDFQLVRADAPGSSTLLDLSREESENALADYTLGYSFTPGLDVLVTHLRLFTGTKVSLWDDGGILLASYTFPDPGGSWREVQLPSPIRLRGSQAYRLALYTGQSGFRGTFDRPRAFSHGSIGDTFDVAGDAFPGNLMNWLWPMVDLRYEVAGPSPARLTPARSGTFANGTWTGSLVALDPADGVLLRVEGPNGHTGTSNPLLIRRAPGTLDRFAWREIPGPSFYNQPFQAKVTALDAFGTVVSNYSGQVQLIGRQAPLPVTIGLGTNRSVYPLATFFRQARSQMIYLADELGGPRTLGALSLHVAVPPDRLLTQWKIRLRHTSLDHYTAGLGWENGDWTLVHNQTVLVGSPGWVQFVFDTPFRYDGQRNLMIDFSFDNPSFSFDGECFATPTPRARTMQASADGEYGAPLLWSDDFPLPELGFERPNLQLASFPLTFAVVPATAGAFVDGSWTGALTVPEAGPDLRLVADDGAGHTGESNPFRSILRDDVSVMLRASANPAGLGEPWTVLSIVSNTGPTAVSGVILTNLLPAGCEIIGVTVSQGNHTEAEGMVRSDFGVLEPGASAQLAVVLSPTAAGPLLTIATVTQDGPDSYPANNYATNLVMAEQRLLVVQTTPTREGDEGPRTLLFRLRLTLPATEPIVLPFTLEDLEATAGLDYVATNGDLVFNSGETELELPITILGDRLYEETESFALRFPAFPTPRLQFFDASGTILDDDPPPNLIVREASVREEDVGVHDAVFRFELSAASGRAVSVFYQTSDGTAVQNSDYVPASGQLLIPPGETNAEVYIQIYGDTELEPDETFHLLLGSVTGATPLVGEALGRILSDDVRAVIQARGSAIVSETVPNQIPDPNETITVDLELLNLGNLDASNVVATLLPGHGVARPSGPVSYGALLASGPSVSRPFTFTVDNPTETTLTANVALRDGSKDLGVVSFQWRVRQLGTFRIERLGADGCEGVEHSHVTGNDRGGIAASLTHLFYVGESGVGVFDLGDLSTGSTAPGLYDVIVSNLKTDTVYALGAGDTPLFGADSPVTSLLRIDGSDGTLTSERIDLSRPIRLGPGSGIFAGLDEVVLHTGDRVFRIDLPGGYVTDLGAMPALEHVACRHWAYWGVAEHFNGSTHLVYVRNSGSIARTRVPDSQTTTLATFSNLGEMCGFTVSLSMNRWYFHHEGASQFQSGEQIIGYCNAGFQLSDELQAHHLEWSPIPKSRLTATPIPVTITARDFAGRRVTNFTGAVALSAVPASIPSTRTLLGSPPLTMSGSGSFTVGYSFTPATNLTVTHVRHCGSGKVSVWSDNGTLLASVPVAGTAEHTWLETPLLSPLILSAGVRYRVGFYTAGDRFFLGTSLSQTFADGVIHQSYQVSGDGFPFRSDLTRWFLVDLRYAPGTFTPLPVSPALSANFVQGEWSGSVSVNEGAPQVILTAQNGNGLFGQSEAFRVINKVSGGVDHFNWEPVGSPQTSGTPFLGQITARDELDDFIAHFSGPVSLSATGVFQAPYLMRGELVPSVSFQPANFTLGFEFIPNTNITVTHVRHYSGTKVSIWDSAGRVLAARPVTSATPGWSQTALPTPLNLRPQERYFVGFVTGSEPYWRSSQGTNTFQHGVVSRSVYAAGDRFPNNPFADGGWLVDLRYVALASTSITTLPTNQVILTNGTWAGYLGLGESGFQVRLQAWDLSGHVGESNPFNVVNESVRLVIERSGARTILSWSALSPGFILEAAESISPSADWTPVPESRSLMGPPFRFTNELIGPQRFYRLIRLSSDEE